MFIKNTLQAFYLHSLCHSLTHVQITASPFGTLPYYSSFKAAAPNFPVWLYNIHPSFLPFRSSIETSSHYATHTFPPPPAGDVVRIISLMRLAWLTSKICRDWI